MNLNVLIELMDPKLLINKGTENENRQELFDIIFHCYKYGYPKCN